MYLKKERPLEIQSYVKVKTLKEKGELLKENEQTYSPIKFEMKREEELGFEYLS